MQYLKLDAGSKNGQARNKRSNISEIPSELEFLRAGSLWHSFGYAFVGLWYVVCTQRNAKIHVALTAAVVALGLWLQVTAIQWTILVLTIGLVFSAEMFNTVIEALVDLVSPAFHPLAKIAKDVAAGAVLLLALTGCVVGLFIFGPGLWQVTLALVARLGGM